MLGARVPGSPVVGTRLQAVLAGVMLGRCLGVWLLGLGLLSIVSLAYHVVASRLILVYELFLMTCTEQVWARMCAVGVCGCVGEGVGVGVGVGAHAPVYGRVHVCVFAWTYVCMHVCMCVHACAMNGNEMLPLAVPPCCIPYIPCSTTMLHLPIPSASRTALAKAAAQCAQCTPLFLCPITKP